MDTEKLFRDRTVRIQVRLVLQYWSELPEYESEEWENLIYVLKAAQLNGGQVLEALHNGVDLFLLLDLSASSSIQEVVEAVRHQLRNPFWQPYINSKRHAWSGCFHAFTVRPRDTLADFPLESPARSWKKRHMEVDLKRTLMSPWHDAPSPKALGIRFLACSHAPRNCEDGWRLYLFYEAPAECKDEAWAAAHLNVRLRVPGSIPFLESEGWTFRNTRPVLVFRVPRLIAPEPPRTIEIWWATGTREKIENLDCLEAGQEPEPFRER